MRRDFQDRRYIGRRRAAGAEGDPKKPGAGRSKEKCAPKNLRWRTLNDWRAAENIGED